MVTTNTGTSGTISGGLLTAAQVYALARSAGFSSAEAITVTAIAKGESGFNPSAVGDVSLQSGDWGPSIGLMQIRSLKSQKGTGNTRDGDRLTDPAFNMASAYSLYRARGSFGDWSVYNSGKYRDSLSLAQTAAGTVGNDYASIVQGIKLPSAGEVADAATAPVKATIAVSKTIFDIGQRLLNPVWWKRIGVGALGVIVLILGFVLLAGQTKLGKDATAAATAVVTKGAV